MKKKEQLDPNANAQVEKAGDEVLKVEETTTKKPKMASKAKPEKLGKSDPAKDTLEEVSDAGVEAEDVEPTPKASEKTTIKKPTKASKAKVAKPDKQAHAKDAVEETPVVEAGAEGVEPATEAPGEVKQEPTPEVKAEAPTDVEPDSKNEVVEETPVVEAGAEGVEPATQAPEKVKEDPTPEVKAEAPTDVEPDSKNEVVEETPVVESGAEGVEPFTQAPEKVKEEPTPEVKDDSTVSTKSEKPSVELEAEHPEKVAESRDDDKKDVQSDKPEDETNEQKGTVSGEPTKEKPDQLDKVPEEDLAELFAKLSREELVLALEALVKNEDVNYIRKRIGLIKVAYHKKARIEVEEKMDHSLESVEDISEGEENEVTQLLDPLKIRFDEAFKAYKAKKYDFDQALEQQKQENLVAKEAILEELRNLIESEEELKKTYDQFRDLQEKWRNIGPVPQLAKNNLWNNYHFLIEKFFDKVKINKELKDLDLKKNLEIKTELCEKAEELLLEKSIVASFQKLQKLHELWKESGPVPNDQKDEIWERFRAVTVNLNKIRQEHYDGLREEQENNYAAKVVLCEKAEQIAELGADDPRKWQEQTNEINELFKVWKTIGFAPKKVNNDIWNRFRAALNAFFKNKKEYLGKFKDIQTENYNQKLNLCIQAEALKDSTDWAKSTNEFIALQKQWKEIGRVPPKFSDKIWKRFRAACDEFFNRKSQFFANIDQTYDENLEKKKELIDNLKKHSYTDDNTDNLKVINEFQRQWMEIGHVPIKQKDKIHAEFRIAIDEKFEALGISRKAKTAMSFRNKMESIKSNPNAETIIYKERSFLVNKISQLQNDINLWENNIGFFASSKKADVLKKEFEDKIEKAKQDIAIMEEKLKILREQ